jgi:translation initiation factor 2 subunit 3
LVARSFDINRPGTKIENLHGGVLGGILKQGTLNVGDKIEIKPGLSSKKNNQWTYKTLTTKIISLHKGDDSVEKVFPGTSISIETELDPFLTKTDSLIGCLVSTEGDLPEITYKVKIKLKLFKEFFSGVEHQPVAPVKSSELLMLSVNTAITVGTVEKMKGDEAELNLNIPIVALKDSNVGIARNVGGHWRLIGFGEVIEQ